MEDQAIPSAAIVEEVPDAIGDYFTNERYQDYVFDTRRGNKAMSDKHLAKLKRIVGEATPEQLAVMEKWAEITRQQRRAAERRKR